LLAVIQAFSGAEPASSIEGVWPQLSLELVESASRSRRRRNFQENSPARRRPITKMAAMPARALPLAAP